MGIPGLTSFIEKYSEQFMNQYYLENTLLIIDGNNLASHIFKWICKSNAVFGGDYDEYEFQVAIFFKNLLKCKITPIVIFDGGYEQQKISTVKHRMKGKIDSLKNLNSILQSNIRFFPLFMKMLFVQVLKELDIPHAHSDFEADNEIAALARILNCPVLSYDSDFFIYGVQYIPFGSMVWDPVEENGRTFIKCSMFDVDKFLAKFKGLSREVLPLIAALVGNDFINRKIFSKFMNHVAISRHNNKSRSQNLITGILHWLKNETLTTAIENIVSHLRKTDADYVKQQINLSIQSYTSTICMIDETLSKYSQLKLTPKNPIQYLKCKCYSDLFRHSEFPSFFNDMLTLNTYFCSPQVEDLTKPSSHTISIQIIKTIFAILHLEDDEKPILRLFSRINTKLLFTEICIKDTMHHFSDVRDYENLIMMDTLQKRNIIYEVCDFNETDRLVFQTFPDDWSLFLIGLISYSKYQKQKLTTLYSFLLCAILLKIVKNGIGYYQNRSKFMKHKGKFYLKVLKEREENITEDQIENDCLLLVPFYLEQRQVNPELKAMPKRLDHSLLHSLAYFQSFFYHLVCLNALLNFPFPNIKISNFVSGTLFYNLYKQLDNKKKLDECVSSILKLTPSILKLFNQYADVLSTYFLEEQKQVRRKKKKTRKNVIEQEIYYENNEEDEWVDENNQFSVLNISLT